MSKYIPVEKLIAEIERQISEWQALIDKDNATCPTTVKTLIYELENILCFIKSLEKEPEVDLEKAARYVYESWMGGTMDDVRRDMVELGKVLNARKEE